MPRWGKAKAGTGVQCVVGEATEAPHNEVEKCLAPGVEEDSAENRSWRKKRCSALSGGECEAQSHLPAGARGCRTSQFRYLIDNRSVEVTLASDAPLLIPQASPLVAGFRDELRRQWNLGHRGGVAAPRSCGLPPFIIDYELRMLQNGVEPFCPPKLVRNWMPDCAGLYDECLCHFPWEQAVMRKRNQETGEVIKTPIESNRQDCTFPRLKTGVPRLDTALAKAHDQLGIKDPGAYLTCNWYSDGKAHIASHRHDFWSAILCFGASRIFLLDGEPVLLNEGDLLVFGTQKHSVPRMVDVTDARISVCIFWYPERRAATKTISLAADKELVASAQAGSVDMTQLILQTLARAGVQGEVVGGEDPGHNSFAAASDSEGSDLDPELAAALEQSLLVR